MEKCGGAGEATGRIAECYSCKNEQMHTSEVDICLVFLVPTCFGHSCDHLQGVPQYKY